MISVGFYGEITDGIRWGLYKILFKWLFKGTTWHISEVVHGRFGDTILGEIPEYILNGIGIPGRIP